jgi:hypothetical protein
MSVLMMFIGGLLITFVLSRFFNWLFGRVMTARSATIVTFIILAGLVAFAAATRMVPPRPAILYAGLPLILWLLLDLSRNKTRLCPHCGRRIPKNTLSCPKCGRDLDTGATVIDDSRRRK